MQRHIVLVVSSDDERLQARHDLVRRAGHMPLPASTINRALFLMSKVRPSLVLTDSKLPDGYADALLSELRAMAAMQHVVVVVLGVLPSDNHARVVQDLRAHVRHADDDTEIGGLLKEHLSAA